MQGGQKITTDSAFCFAWVRAPGVALFYTPKSAREPKPEKRLILFLQGMPLSKTSNNVKHGEFMKQIRCYKATPQKIWMKRGTEILVNYVSKVFEGC